MTSSKRHSPTVIEATRTKFYKKVAKNDKNAGTNE